MLPEDVVKNANWKGGLVVMSGKGGVGKSTIATSVARSITNHGIRVGLIDLDIDSPSIPTITGTTPDDIGITGYLLEPANSNGVKVFSIGHLLPSEDTPILWAGSRKENALIDVFKSCNFADVEFLVIDLPPGTGDELYGVTKIIPSVGAIVVTLPQKLSQVSVKKALKALERYEIKVLGIIENMSGFKCPKCSAMVYPFKHGTGKKLADTYGVEFLGAIPIMQDISSEADNGSVETIVNSTEFESIVNKVIQKLGLLPETFTPIVGEERGKDEGEKGRTEEEESEKESGEERGGKVTVKKEIEKEDEKKRKGVGRITATVKEKEGKEEGGGEATKKKRRRGKKKVKVKGEHKEEVGVNY